MVMEAVALRVHREDELMAKKEERKKEVKAERERLRKLV